MTCLEECLGHSKNHGCFCYYYLHMNVLELKTHIFCFLYSYMGLCFVALFLAPFYRMFYLCKPVFLCDHVSVSISLWVFHGSLHPGILCVPIFYLLSSSPLLFSGFSSSGFHVYVSISFLFLLCLMLCPSELLLFFLVFLQF